MIETGKECDTQTS